jgi:hypothetical protein
MLRRNSFVVAAGVGFTSWMIFTMFAYFYLSKLWILGSFFNLFWIAIFLVNIIRIPLLDLVLLWLLFFVLKMVLSLKH